MGYFVSNVYPSGNSNSLTRSNKTDEYIIKLYGMRLSIKHEYGKNKIS